MSFATIFFLGIILSASGILPTPLALALGLLFGFTLRHPFPHHGRQLAHFLLQASVVCLGFGMQLGPVMKAGSSGFVYTAISITIALGLGWLLGRVLRVQARQSFLISIGTAICGGSAIAAVGPVMQANEEEMAVSLGTVFTLNAIALLAFPPLGHALGLSQTQFGLWCALAIHDTSSVVGAAASYGPLALLTGTTVKLARALWIVPVTFAVAFVSSRRGEASAESNSRIRLPWFILLFLLAAVLTTWVPAFTPAYSALNHLGRSGLTVVLFLIGTGLSLQTLRRIGPRPMIQGVVLWLIVAAASLLAIAHGLIAI